MAAISRPSCYDELRGRLHKGRGNVEPENTVTRSRASIASIIYLVFALVLTSVGFDRPAHAADGDAEPDNS
jgi:hypothetical protein